MPHAPVVTLELDEHEHIRIRTTCRECGETASMTIPVEHLQAIRTLLVALPGIDLAGSPVGHAIGLRVAEALQAFEARYPDFVQKLAKPLVIFCLVASG